MGQSNPVNDYTAVIRACADGRTESVWFWAATRDEALFEAGLFAGANYSGRWELVELQEGCVW